MRTVSDADIEAQAKQPDIPYINPVQLMDVADSLNYTHDDYMALADACGKFCYSPSIYQGHRDSIRAQVADYLAESLETKNSIIAEHW